MGHLEIRELTQADRDDAVEVINEAAKWYGEFLPPDEMHSPEMDHRSWEAEALRMIWWGAFVQDDLVG